MAWIRCGGSTSAAGTGAFSFSFKADVSGSWNASAGDERSMLKITAIGETTASFGAASTGITNCSSNHGFIEIRKNGTAVHSVTLPPNTTTAIGNIPDVTLSAGDVLEIIFGFTGSHTNINMHFYDGEIQIDGSATIEGPTTSNSTVSIL